MNQDITIVHMTSLESARFIDFMKYYDVFDKLYKAGAFKIRQGSVTLQFDTDGKLCSVEKKEVTRF